MVTGLAGNDFANEGPRDAAKRTSESRRDMSAMGSEQPFAACASEYWIAEGCYADKAAVET